MINQRRYAKVLQLAERATGGLEGARITVLGVTFKSGSDDIRESPALLLMGEFAAAGALVSAYDLAGMDKARRTVPNAQYASTMADALHQAELVCVLTEWDEFRTADPVALGELVRSRRVIDGRNCLDAERWRAAGWHYSALGRPSGSVAAVGA